MQRNYENKEGSIYSDDYVSRMVRLDPKRHFVGKIHEYLIPIPEKTVFWGLGCIIMDMFLKTKLKFRVITREIADCF